ncbi:glycine cleavage system aminomethyltransferase GcvT [Motilibacter deserti]|uniref:Aminomethyltransferase n=1 Tax=Motilibacter deserti TaxID=2714956 RepID=A0ABX0GRR4_9ACTN|nr:glycine cleavage system aminomethyltransferase GcvT [Motilibacter deserti]NHC12451.1 glycine cleavage system aminomethyltransferase GcvT [Motilibacter deserti]
MADAAAAPRRPALHDRHVALGAKLAPFGGWEMPLQYAGVVREHTAVRERVGAFDVSHLGTVLVRGASAASYVNSTLTNDLGRIAPGMAQYTLCCTEDGGVVDDLIVYLRAEDDLLLVPNASNVAEVARRLAEGAPSGVRVEDVSGSYAVLAVQGPRSDATLEAVSLPAGHPYMSFVDTARDGVPVTVCRTGYTGERGYELVLPAADAGAVWDALLAAGAEPCGLGARDTLRLEMGYPLHGQDLSLEISPVQARSSWAVGWAKPVFWGREALLAERAAGPRRVLQGIESLDRGIPRRGMAVSSPDGGQVGEVTSGTFSPTRQVGIGLALLDPAVEVGAELTLDVRGRVSRVRVVRPPFVESSVR